jgi:hypothetical protein
MGAGPDKNDFSTESHIEDTSATGDDFSIAETEEVEVEETNEQSGLLEKGKNYALEGLSYITGVESQGRDTILGTFWATDADEAKGLRGQLVSGEPNRGGDKPIRGEYPTEDDSVASDGGESEEELGFTRRGTLQGIAALLGGGAAASRAGYIDWGGGKANNTTGTPTPTFTETTPDPTETPEPTETPTETPEPTPDYMVDLGKFIGEEGQEDYEVDMRAENFWGSLEGTENVNLGVQDTGDLIAFNSESQVIYEFESGDFPDSEYFDIPETGMDPHPLGQMYSGLEEEIEELPEGAAKTISEDEDWRENKDYKSVQMDEVVDHLVENTDNGYEIMADYMFDFKMTAETGTPLYEDEWTELLE